MIDNPTGSVPRDAGSLSPDELPRRVRPENNGAANEPFQVVCKRSVLQEIYRHGASSRDREVCGVLVGRLYRDDAGPFLAIDGCIRGEHATNLAAQVTFTSETWSHIHRVMSDSFADQTVVGWYHTHPGFGIFLSAMDLFIHENFFDLPWQVAFVHDPLSGEDGMFVWRNGQATRESHLIDNDVPLVGKTSVGEQTILASTPVRQKQRRSFVFRTAIVLGTMIALSFAGFLAHESYQNRTIVTDKHDEPADPIANPIDTKPDVPPQELPP